MPRQPTEPTAASIKKTREAIEKDLEAFLASGKKIQYVKPGATGQDENNRSKHIVISRKHQQPPPRRS